MLLFRMGPRYMFVRSSYIDEITSFLVEKLNGEIVEFNEGLARSSEYSTLCFITDINHEKTHIEDAKKIVLIHDVSSFILSAIINNKGCELLNRIDMGPASIAMRVLGDETKLIEKLKEVFSAKEVDWVEGIGLGEKNDTIISFTHKELSGPVSDVLDTKLLIPQPVSKVKGKLRLEGFRFITQSLKDSQWYELRINIYDAYGKYIENYERLMFVFSKLEVGMVLGESWTKDYAVLLYFVMTYQVRLFTFFTPQEIKEILMALEYTKDKKRLVDFDIYYKNKKVYWYDVSKNKGRVVKTEESNLFRKKLYEKLKPEDIITLEAMEEAIIDSYPNPQA